MVFVEKADSLLILKKLVNSLIISLSNPALPFLNPISSSGFKIPPQLGQVFESSDNFEPHHLQNLIILYLLCNKFIKNCY